jgi:hypothetical protein
LAEGDRWETSVWSVGRFILEFDDFLRSPVNNGAALPAKRSEPSAAGYSGARRLSYFRATGRALDFLAADEPKLVGSLIGVLIGYF